MSGPRLSITPAGAIFDRRLEPRDQQVLNLLGCYTDKAGWCRRSQVKMAKQLNCGRSSIQRSLENLVAAGWVEKKRPPWSKEEGQPSNSYMYRVILDRDDFTIPSDQDEDAHDEADDSDSHAEDALEAGDCPPVGTPEKPTHGHPGAQPSVGTGAHTYVGTKNVPLERPLIERERDARARDRKARFIAAFEQRWPTAAADDRQRTGYAAEALTEDEEQAALAGIGPFLENLKRLGRKNTPAGWRYLEEKRWTLLEAKAASEPVMAQFAPGSPEGRAIAALYALAGKTDFFHRVIHREGKVWCRIDTGPQLLALADLPAADQWRSLTRQQAGAWNSFIGSRLGNLSHARLGEGSLAPHPWPPRKDGSWPPDGPAEPVMNNEDLEALSSEGQR